MTDNSPQHVDVRTFRNETKDILDGTRFLKRCYVVTNYVSWPKNAIRSRISRSARITQEGYSP
jgi:hypothetical protein